MQEVYRFIRDVMLRGQAPPSVREIQAALGFRSTSTVHFYLKQLESQGLIRRNERASRGIELVANPLRAVAEVPLVGRVTAGQPTLAQEEVAEVLLVPRGFAGEDAFALTVRGDSMIGAGILDGDTVVVDRGARVEDGDIVVALLDDEATVKRLFREGDSLRLQPENPAYPPVRSSTAQILGRVVALFRRY
jgi:repressor LexA